ncbi:MAG: sugar ABC transporter ATP-binding protein [Gemmataceae bacterium]
MPDDSALLLEARGISKAFPGIQALQNVNLSLRRAEVLAIVGENGAGKSTLMKILGGVYVQDSGEVLLDGKPVELGTVEGAQNLGIALIHQELNLAENLDVAGNIFLGREPRWAGPLKLIDRSIYGNAALITRRLGLECSTRASVGRLSIGQQQLVEIARALSLKSRILIMDEPTSSLTQRETHRLFEVIRDLVREKMSIIYISHRLQEVEQIADRVSVLRDGRNAGDLDKSSIRHDAMVRLMVGRELKQFFQRTEKSVLPSSARAAPLLRVSALITKVSKGKPISFNLKPGEIVGMAGLMGAGRSELAEALFGIDPSLGGEVFLDGRPIGVRTPAQAIEAGLFLLPEDRRTQGLILAASVKDNISLASLDRVSWLSFISRHRERELAQDTCEQLNVRTSSIDKAVGLLSGGNQQKVVLGKWLCREPRVLILDEPTRGVDVGAKTEIYGLIDKLAGQGVAILMISSDLEEILGMSDRVLVMHQGGLAGELPREELSEQAIMHLATGGFGRP